MNQDEKISVLVVDDHQVIREGITTLLSTANDIEVVGQAASFSESVRKAKKHNPNVILLDIRLPGTSGWEACRVLTSKSPTVRVIMFTSFEHEDYLLMALRAGAHGYLLKTASQDEIVSAIRAVARGERLLSASLIDRLVVQFSKLASKLERLESGMDEEDIVILKLVSEGATNAEIAERTYWSEVTVKRKLKKIYEKLSVRDRTSAAVEALKRGLL